MVEVFSNHLWHVYNYLYSSYRMHIQSVYAEVKGRQVHALKHL